MCDEKCRFTLWGPDGELECTNTCDLDKDGVDDRATVNDGIATGTSVHGLTHLCAEHNNLRLRRRFGTRLTQDETGPMKKRW